MTGTSSSISETPEQQRALDKLIDQFKSVRVRWPIDSIGRMQASCRDFHDNDAGTFIIEPDGRIRGI